MTQRFKNPNRSVPKTRAKYVPEYLRHGVAPIPIDENGRIDESLIQQQPSVLGLGSMRKQHRPPLNVAFVDNSGFKIDGSDFSSEEDFYEDDVEIPSENHKPIEVQENEERLSPGDFLVLMDNKIIDSGSEEKIKKTIFSLVYESSVDPDDIVVFKRMEVSFGINIR